MRTLIEFTLAAFSMTFVIIDPLGVVPIFIILTPNDTREQRRAMARRACVVAWGVLTAFALGGEFVMHTLGISLAAFKIAGALLLLITAIDQLRGRPSGTRTSPAEQSEAIAKEDVSIVPLAMPMLAGPGSIATAMMLAARTPEPWYVLIVLAAITFTLAVAFGTLMLGERIERMLGTTGRLIAERLGGLVLAAFAVQFILDGFAEAWHR